MVALALGSISTTMVISPPPAALHNAESNGQIVIGGTHALRDATYMSVVYRRLEVSASVAVFACTDIIWSSMGPFQLSIETYRYVAIDDSY